MGKRKSATAPEIRNEADVLLGEIDEFLKRHEMAPGRFGTEALNNSHFYRRLKKTRNVLSQTVQRVRQYMAEYDGAIKPPESATLEPQEREG